MSNAAIRAAEIGLEMVAEKSAEIERLRSALAPFAAIGGLLNMAGKDAMPDGVSASRLRLDGLTAEHFRDAHNALTGTLWGGN